MPAILPTLGTGKQTSRGTPERLWSFFHQEGGQSTNNAGRRSLRLAVIWRTLSFGTQRAASSRFVETLLSAIETCRQQRRNALSFSMSAVDSASRPSTDFSPGWKRFWQFSQYHFTLGKLQRVAREHGQYAGIGLST